MSGFGRRGATLKARDKITGSGAYVFCVVRGVPAGPWAILNDGAAPHDITARRRRRRKRGALGVPGGPFARVSHPGTKPGKRTWERVKSRASDEVPRLFGLDVHRAVEG